MLGCLLAPNLHVVFPTFYHFQPPGTHGPHPTKSLERGRQAHSQKEGKACPAPLRSPSWPCGLSETAALRFGGE